MKMKKVFLALLFTALISLGSFSQKLQSTSKFSAENIALDTSKQNNEKEGRSGPGMKSDLKGVWVIKAGMMKLKAKNSSVEDVIIESNQAGTASSADDDPIKAEKKSTDKSPTPTSETIKENISSAPTINFLESDESVIAGFSGCNNFTGKYVCKEDKLTFQEFGTFTNMACSGEYNESIFMERLKNVDSFRMNKGDLEMLNKDKVALVFYKEKATK